MKFMNENLLRKPADERKYKSDKCRLKIGSEYAKIKIGYFNGAYENDGNGYQ